MKFVSLENHNCLMKFVFLEIIIVLWNLYLLDSKLFYETYGLLCSVLRMPYEVVKSLDNLIVKRAPYAWLRIHRGMRA